MSFTYTAANITATNDPISVIRFKLADTVEAERYLENEEITALHDATPTAYQSSTRTAMAAADCADYIVAKLAREIEWASDGNSVKLVDQYKRYREVAQTLRADADAQLARETGGNTLSVLYVRR